LTALNDQRFDTEEEDGIPIPHPIAAMSADKVREYVLGKEIIWRNSISRGTESAHVLPRPDQRQLRIEYGANKRRILVFASAGGGYRSVYLDSILDIK
jgi:hypothetical protein